MGVGSNVRISQNTKTPPIRFLHAGSWGLRGFVTNVRFFVIPKMSGLSCRCGSCFCGIGTRVGVSVWPERADGCVFCGGSLAGRARQARYCSTRCRWDANHRKQIDAARNQLRLSGGYAVGDSKPCEVCGSVFVKRSVRHATCSVECASELRGVELWRRELPPHSAIAIVGCDDCGRLTVCKTRKGGTCSECSMLRARERYRRKNMKRRGAAGKPLTVRELLDRDGNICYICDRAIDVSLSGSDNLGPTVDHVIPLARGGTNQGSNLRLTHRQCNTKKGVSLPALIPA